MLLLGIPQIERNCDGAQRRSSPATVFSSRPRKCGKSLHLCHLSGTDSSFLYVFSYYYHYDYQGQGKALGASGEFKEHAFETLKRHGLDRLFFKCSFAL